MGTFVSEADALSTPVYAADGYKPFREFTVEDVRLKASELAAATGWGPTARVGAVARGWSALGSAMASAGAGTVAELDPTAAHEHARQLWIGRSLL
jgi:hypothetical protein